jgi:hypothetical protein
MIRIPVPAFCKTHGIFIRLSGFMLKIFYICQILTAQQLH